jgi:predicted amidophosphoribosyltransferase
VLELLLPRRCVVCGRPRVDLCGACVGELPRLAPPLCERCGAPTLWPVLRCGECGGRRLAFVRARAAVEYEDGVPLVVAAWKDRGLRGLARLAAELTAETLARPAVDAVAFVPPDGDRSIRRGHHPPERFARELARRWELPVVAALRRTRDVRAQRGLDLAERRRNVSGAFAASRSVPRRVLLVDDVYTSGSTATAAASALRRAAARHVEVVTFARAVRRR